MNSPSELVFFSFHEKTLKPFIGSSSFPAPWMIFYCFWKYYFPFNQLGHAEQCPRSITCSDTCQTLPGMYCMDDSQALGGRHFIVLPSGQWKPPLLSRPTRILLNWSPLSAYLKVLWEPWHADFPLPSLLMKASFLHFLYHSLRMGVFFMSILSSFFLSLFSVLSPLCLHRLWVTHQPMFVWNNINSTFRRNAQILALCPRASPPSLQLESPSLSSPCFVSLLLLDQ